MAEISRPLARGASILVAVLALALAGSPRGADAQDAQPAASSRSARDVFADVWNRDKLGGDWLGIRKNLTDHGIYPGLRMTQFYQGSTSGGIRDHDEYGGLMEYRVNVDMNKLLGTWSGLFASLKVETRWGEDIQADIGAYNLVNTPLLYPKPGDYDATQVTSLMLAQAFFEGRFEVFAGKLNAVDLVTGIFPNMAYGQEGFTNINALATAWPWLRFVNLVMWGGGGWLNDEKGRIQGGLIFFGQENVSTTWELGGSFNDGVGYLGFYRYFWEIEGLEGYVFLGVGGATKAYETLDETDTVVLFSTGTTDFVTVGLGDRDREPWAIAPYAYQEFWKGDDGRKAYLFMGGSVAREEPSFADWNIFAAVEAIGALPFRKADRMGFAGWYNNLPKDLKNLASTLGTRLRDSWGFELYYNIALNRWLHVTGDLQFVQDARRGDNMAVVPGLRVVIDF